MDIELVDPDLLTILEGERVSASCRTQLLQAQSFDVGSKPIVYHYLAADTELTLLTVHGETGIQRVGNSGQDWLTIVRHSVANRAKVLRANARLLA